MLRQRPSWRLPRWRAAPGPRLGRRRASGLVPSATSPPSRACAPDGRPRMPLDVHVLTFGPGDHPFLKFGHDALWIHDDREAGTDRVYNFGTFSFDSPRLIFDFLGGRMTYWLSVSYAAGGARRVRAREPHHSDAGADARSARRAGAAGARWRTTPAPRTAPTSTTTSSTTARRACATPSTRGGRRRCASRPGRRGGSRCAGRRCG